MLRSTDLFLSQRGVIVASVHRDVRGMSPHGDPVTKLELGVDNTLLGQSILVSLQGSRDRLSEDEFEHQMAVVLGELGDATWDIVARKWDMISFTLNEEESEVSVLPTKRRKGGWLSREEPQVVSAVPDQVGFLARKLMQNYRLVS